MENQKLAYSIKAAVEATSYSRSYLYKVISEGRLKTYQRGGRKFIEGEELKRFILDEAKNG